jgi:hypothetical protein
MMVIDSRQKDLMRDDSLGNSSDASKVVEIQQAARNGGVVILFDIDEISGVTLQRSTQSGISGSTSAQSQQSQSYVTQSSQLLREQAYHKILSFATSCAFIGGSKFAREASVSSLSRIANEFCVSFVFTSDSFICSRIEQSWNFQRNLELGKLFCPKNVHISEGYVSIDSSDHNVLGIIPGNIEVGPSQSFFVSFRPSINKGSLSAGVCIANSNYHDFKNIGDNKFS